MICRYTAHRRQLEILETPRALFYPRGWAAPLRGIAPIAALERFSFFLCTQIIVVYVPRPRARRRGHWELLNLLWMSRADSERAWASVVKFEQIPLFYPRGWAAPLLGMIAPLTILERFVYSSWELIEFIYEMIIWIHSLHEFIHEFIHMNSLWNDHMNS